MHSQTEQTYLLRAMDVFRRKIIVVSRDFKILAASARVKNDFGDDIVGCLCHKVFRELDSPCESCAVKDALETGEPRLNFRTDMPDPRIIPCYYAYPIYSGDTIDAMVSMDFDIPDLTELQEKLQKSNALLRNLILSAVDGVIAADKKGRILIFNEAASQVFGYSVDEALRSLDIRNIYPDKIEYKIMEKLRGGDYGGRGKLRQYQVDVLSKEGVKIPINLNAAIVYDGEKEAATIGFFHDMREELHMKEQLEKTQIQLLQSEKMASLGKLAAGVAHQLNNPLGGITLFAKLMIEEYELEEAAREDLERILRDAERCKDTVKELLEFSRQTRYLMRPHDINRALSRTMFLLENQSLFQNIVIEKNLGDGLPQVIVDIQQINHLFMNIILNAAQAMGGRGTLGLKTYRNAGEEHVTIEISDTGPGIPRDIRSRVFEPFYTTKQEGEGTGLGLSLAYSIVENHGGAIFIRSKSAKGTTFVIELPLKKSEGEDLGEKD